MYNFSPKISKAKKFIQPKTTWKITITLKKYRRNNKESNKSYRYSHLRRVISFTNFVRKDFLADGFCYMTGGHFKNSQLKSIMYPFCRSLGGNQIEELPAGVFSNNNKLLNLWVGRLKVHSRPTYFYYHILLQILVNSKILKYYRTLLTSPATIVLREEPYLLVHFLSYAEVNLRRRKRW